MAVFAPPESGSRSNRGSGLRAVRLLCAAAWYLVETFGVENFWKFYRSYASVPAAQLYGVLPSGTGGEGDPAVLALASETTESSLRKIFGFGQDGLDIRVKQWISTQTQ